jgi:hypothetical protein
MVTRAVRMRKKIVRNMYLTATMMSMMRLNMDQMLLQLPMNRQLTPLVQARLDDNGLV